MTPWNWIDFRRDRAAGIDKLAESLARQDAPVDDPDARDLDDLVAIRRTQPGRLGIEDHEAEAVQRCPAEFRRGDRLVKQGEVEEIRAGGRGDVVCMPVKLLGRRHRDPHPGMARPGVLAPQLAAVVLEHVADRQATKRVGQRLVHPAVDHRRCYGRAFPRDIDIDPGAARLGRHVEVLYAGDFAQTLNQMVEQHH